MCWTPFFVVHITRGLCPTCAVPPRLVSAVTWLGYVNSALNPVIYTVFNAEFRSVFRKALRLCCWADPSACAHCVLCEDLGPGGPGHASGGRTPVREGVLYD